MTTKEMIEVMQAYERGEQIECVNKHCENDSWEVCTPEWNWLDCEYRVKSKPTHRPYKNAEEFLAAQECHGMYLLLKWNKQYRLPLFVTDHLVGIGCLNSLGGMTGDNTTYAELMENYTWQDDTPCGVKEE